MILSVSMFWFKTARHILVKMKVSTIEGTLKCAATLSPTKGNVSLLTEQDTHQGKLRLGLTEDFNFCYYDYKLTKNCVKFVVRFNIFTFCSESELQGLERMPSTFSHLKHWPSPSLEQAQLEPGPVPGAQHSQPGVRPPCCSSLQSLFTPVSTSVTILHIC